MTTDDWIKIGGGIIGGGFLGAIYTNWRTDRRNKIQPVGRKIRVSYVDLPSVMDGHSVTVSLKKHSESSTPYYFNQLAIIQLELLNKGNQNFDKFEFAIDLPEDNVIVGIQHEGVGRLHKVENTPQVSIAQPSSHLDITLKPFNRNERYSISLVVNAEDNSLEKFIEIDKIQSVKLVDIDTKENSFFLIGQLVTMLMGLLIGANFFIKNLGSFNAQHDSIVSFALLTSMLALSMMLFIMRSRNKS